MFFNDTQDQRGHRITKRHLTGNYTTEVYLKKGEGNNQLKRGEGGKGETHIEGGEGGMGLTITFTADY